MYNNDTIIAKLHSLQPQLKKRYHYSKMALFGSYARGEQCDNSDVDCLIWASKKDYFTLIDLQKQLVEELGCSVDIGYYDSLRSFVKREIESDIVYV